MCAHRDEGSDVSLSIGSVDDSSVQESFPEVLDSEGDDDDDRDEVVAGGRLSSDDEELTLTRSSAPNSRASAPSSTASIPPSTAGTHPSTAPSTDGSYSDHDQQQPPSLPQQQSTRRTSRASSKARVATERNRRRCQLPLREVVPRRAFECTIGARGELSKVVDVVIEGKSAALEADGEPVTESEDGSDETPRHHRRPSHGRPPSSKFRVEPVPYGADIYIDQEVGAGLSYFFGHTGTHLQ